MTEENSQEDGLPPLIDTIRFNSIKNVNDTLTYLTNVFPFIGTRKTVEASMQFNKLGEKSKYAGYFIQDRKYLVGDEVRLRFKFSKPNLIWD